MGLLNLENYAPQVGLLNEEQRKNAAMMGWFNTAANLFDASAPQPMGQQKTPLQMLGTGMKGFAQGAGDYTQGAVQSNMMAKKLKEEQDRKDWADRISSKLGQFGLTPDLASGMTPDEQQAFIAKAVADQRDNAAKEKLYNMVTDRTLAGQALIADRQAAAQAAMMKHQDDQQEADYKRQMDLLEKRMAAESTMRANKPLPATIAMKQNELLEDIGSTSGTMADLSTFKKQIEDGELNLGLISNAWNKLRNGVGISSDDGTKLASFQTSLEKMRNDSLRLNKGVQTEGDAIRAWDELVGSISDEKKTKTLLGKIININKRAADLKKAQIGQLREEYGKDQVDFTPYENVQSAVGGGVDLVNPSVVNKVGGGVEEYDYVNGKLVPRWK